MSKTYNQYREFYIKAGEELLDYYNERVSKEASKPNHVAIEDDLPF